MTQRCLISVACPLVYDSHLSSADLWLHHMSGRTRLSHKVSGSQNSYSLQNHGNQPAQSVLSRTPVLLREAP